MRVINIYINSFSSITATQRGVPLVKRKETRVLFDITGTYSLDDW